MLHNRLVVLVLTAFVMLLAGCDGDSNVQHRYGIEFHGVSPDSARALIKALAKTGHAKGVLDTMFTDGTTVSLDSSSGSIVCRTPLTLWIDYAVDTTSKDLRIVGIYRFSAYWRENARLLKEFFGSKSLREEKWFDPTKLPIAGWHNIWEGKDEAEINVLDALIYGEGKLPKSVNKNELLAEILEPCFMFGGKPNADSVQINIDSVFVEHHPVNSSRLNMRSTAWRFKGYFRIAREGSHYWRNFDVTGHHPDTYRFYGGVTICSRKVMRMIEQTAAAMAETERLELGRK